MTQEAYIEYQITNIDRAISFGRELLRTSAGLHKICNDAEDGKASTSAAKNDILDLFMYYDFNTAVADISGMPSTLKEFKQKLIDIKIENDRMLLEGGYRKDIDEAITGIFLKHTLCKVKIIDEPVLDTVKEAIETLEALKENLSK